MPSLKLGLLAVACATLLVGCGPRTRFIQVLANVRDAAPGAAWPREMRILKTAVLPYVGAGDTLVVAPIGDHAYTDAPVADVTLERSSAFGANPLQSTLRNQALLRGLFAMVERRLEADRSSGHTEIIAATMAAMDRFNGEPNASKILILDSTGYEQSSLVNMADVHQQLDPRSIALLIASIRRANELPSLSGVRVCVAGISSGEGGWAVERRVLAIRAFWRAFFRAAGARLVSYGITPTGCLS
ncbi:MAG: hypothetical protein ACYC8W_07370 [Candidatus Tyrphobacter sp.]